MYMYFKGLEFYEMLMLSLPICVIEIHILTTKSNVSDKKLVSPSFRINSIENYN